MLIGLLLFIVGIGCSSANEAAQPTGAPAPISLSEIYHFESLPEMTATSDTVIIGTVTAQLDDRLLVAIAGETPAMRFLRFEVTPDEILTGSLETPTIVIEIDEYYARYVDDTPWSQIGQTSLLFLREKLGSAETLYLPINSQGIYRIDSQGQLKGARASDALVK